MGRQNTASSGCGANLRLPPSPGPLLKRVFLCLPLGVVYPTAEDDHSVMRLSFFLLLLPLLHASLSVSINEPLYSELGGSFFR